MSALKDLTGLTNIGTTIAQRLNDVGIYTEAALREAGPAEAFRRIERAHPGATIPICYYLYSLEGALSGVHWDDVPEQRKRELLDAVDHPDKYRLRSR